MVAKRFLYFYKRSAPDYDERIETEEKINQRKRRVGVEKRRCPSSITGFFILFFIFSVYRVWYYVDIVSFDVIDVYRPQN